MTQLLTPEAKATLEPYNRVRRQWGYCYLDENGDYEREPNRYVSGPRYYLLRKLELVAGSVIDPPKWAPKRAAIYFYHHATKRGQHVVVVLNEEGTQFDAVLT